MYFKKEDQELIVEPISKAFKKKFKPIYKGLEVGLDKLKGRIEIDPDL